MICADKGRYLRHIHGMLGYLKKRSGTPCTKEGERIYAVGDVHGRFDLLHQMLKLIVAHYEALDLKAKRVSLLFLGDIIDRGPMSSRCVERIKYLVDAKGAHLLLGNHEDMLLASIEGDADAQRAWLKHGGDQTLLSYGIPLPRTDEDAIDFAERLGRAFPEEHLEFLRQCPASYRSGDYLFVHAGVRPGVSLKRQDSRDLFSIREEFTESDSWHGAMIVHGHSIVERIEIRQNRIACDTGAYRTGRLSCICLQDEYQATIST